MALPEAQILYLKEGMAQFHSSDPRPKDFICGLAGNRLNQFRVLDGRGIRRAAERKRRIEAKKQARYLSSKEFNQLVYEANQLQGKV